MFYNKEDEKYEERKIEWQEIEDLVMLYQKQFQDNIDNNDIKQSKKAADEILSRFNPLIKKYLVLIKTGKIIWKDVEMKSFISNFIDKKYLLQSLNRKCQISSHRDAIYKKFEFIVETYGSLPEEDIIIDLQSLLLLKAKNYKPMGKNFCSYLYNSYKYEVARHIKKFIQNPLNVSYKNMPYEDFLNGENEPSYEEDYDEFNTGTPTHSWICGDDCSDIFKSLSVLDRKILVKYYLDEWNDNQIANHFGMHINTVNQRRRNASKKIANLSNINLTDIKRTRRSGKKALLPLS